MNEERCSLHSFLSFFYTLTDSIMWPFFKRPRGVLPLLFSNHNQPFFCLLKLVKRKHLRRSAGNNVEGCFVAKKHMGPHIKTRSLRCFNATQLLEPHKRPPTQACDWQLHDGETASLRNIQQTHKCWYFSGFLFEWSETST